MTKLCVLIPLFVGLLPLSLAAAPVHRSVIVVGGGISGMTATYELQKRGVDVLLLEEDDHLGGRLTSAEMDRVPFDLGAQMLPSRSARMLALVRELGLENELIEVSNGVLLAREGRLYAAQLNSPSSLISSGYLSIWQILDPRKLWNLAQLLGDSRRPVDDITKWTDLDNETVNAWSDASGLGSLKNWVLDPILSPIFGSVGTTSKSTLFWIYNYVANSEKIYSLRGGLGGLSQALAQRIPHTLNVTVEEIREQADGQVILETSNGTYLADRVILTTPAHVSARLLNSSCCSYERALLEKTRYYSTLVLTVRTNKSWANQLKGVYSILFPPSESNSVQAVAVASAFDDRLRGMEGNVLQIYFRNEFAKANLSISKDELGKVAARVLEKHLPGFGASITDSSIQVWKDAIPISNPGKARLVDSYRKSTRRCSILLAGDALNFSGVEPAAATGAWAAEQIFKDR